MNTSGPLLDAHATSVRNCETMVLNTPPPPPTIHTQHREREIDATDSVTLDSPVFVRRHGIQKSLKCNENITSPFKFNIAQELRETCFYAMSFPSLLLFYAHPSPPSRSDGIRVVLLYICPCPSVCLCLYGGLLTLAVTLDLCKTDLLNFFI